MKPHEPVIEETHGGRPIRFSVVLETSDEGGFSVRVPALPGCLTQGEDEAEALSNAREAIICYLEGLEKLNAPRSRTRRKAEHVVVVTL